MILYIYLFFIYHMYVILLLIIFISFMNDNNELIPIIIDINLDIETINQDSFNITIFYDFDLVSVFRFRRQK